MSIKTKQNGVDCWLDENNIAVPVKHIDKNIKKRDKLVSKIYKKAIKLHNIIAKTKEEISNDVDDYLESISEEYGENWKGNAELKDFADNLSVSVKINNLIEFDEKLRIAKQKIDECITRWGKKADKNLGLLVKSAFKTNKEGKLNKKLILSLRTYPIQDNEWKDAMEIINDSIKIASTKKYYIIKHKDTDGNWKSISLNFSDV